MRDEEILRAKLVFNIFISLSVSHWQIYTKKLITQPFLCIFLSNYFVVFKIMFIFAIGIGEKSRAADA